MAKLLGAFTPQECANYFKNAGYNEPPSHLRNAAEGGGEGGKIRSFLGEPRAPQGVALRFRIHPLGEAVMDKTAEICFSFEDRFTPPAHLIGSGGVKRRISARGERVAPQRVRW